MPRTWEEVKAELVGAEARVEAAEELKRQTHAELLAVKKKLLSLTYTATVERRRSAKLREELQAMPQPGSDDIKQVSGRWLLPFGADGIRFAAWQLEEVLNQLSLTQYLPSLRRADFGITDCATATPDEWQSLGFLEYHWTSLQKECRRVLLLVATEPWKCDSLYVTDKHPDPEKEREKEPDESQSDEKGQLNTEIDDAGAQRKTKQSQKRTKRRQRAKAKKAAAAAVHDCIAEAAKAADLTATAAASAAVSLAVPPCSPTGQKIRIGYYKPATDLQQLAQLQLAPRQVKAPDALPPCKIVPYHGNFVRVISKYVSGCNSVPPKLQPLVRFAASVDLFSTRCML